VLSLIQRHKKAGIQAEFRDFISAPKHNRAVRMQVLLIARRRVLYCVSVFLGVQTYGKSKNLDALRVGSAGIRSFLPVRLDFSPKICMPGLCLRHSCLRPDLRGDQRFATDSVKSRYDYSAMIKHLPYLPPRSNLFSGVTHILTQALISCTGAVRRLLQLKKFTAFKLSLIHCRSLPFYHMVTWFL